MGFLLSNPLSDIAIRQPSTKTFVEAVDNLLISCGHSAVGSLLAPSKHTLAAMGAVNNACERIWTANQWEWRHNWVNFSMESSVMFYELPADYEEYSSGPVSVGNRIGLTMTSYEHLVSAVPDMYDMPGYEKLGLDATSGLAAQKAAEIMSVMVDRNYHGKPTHWGIKGRFMFLWRVPDESLYDDFELEGRMLFGYYRAYKTLTLSEDEIPLPPALHNAMHFLALGYYKQVFEYADFSVDEQRGEGLLMQARARSRRIGPEDTYPGFDYSGEL
jgi:hypothetical protein